LIRDIPGTAILGGNKTTNLRQLIEQQMAKNGERSRCIRSREIRGKSYDPADAKLITRKYQAAGGTEYFLSYELPDESLLAMLRLRIPSGNEQPVMRSLKNSAVIRELHTFGTIAPIAQKSPKSVQHIGFGKLLLKEAEKLATEHRMPKISVISGVGVKEYYRKNGYEDDGTYLAKHL
jgi:elongator complex protein 3